MVTYLLNVLLQRRLSPEDARSIEKALMDATDAANSDLVAEASNLLDQLPDTKVGIDP